MTILPPLLTDEEIYEAVRTRESLNYLTDDECRWVLFGLLAAIKADVEYAAVLRSELGREIAQQYRTRPDGYAGEALAERMRRKVGQA